MVYIYLGTIIRISNMKDVSNLYKYQEPKEYCLFNLFLYIYITISFVDFNFTSTNSLIDGYFIDMTDLNSCSPITKKGGVNPIHSNDPTITSIVRYCIIFCKLFSNLVTDVFEHNFIFRNKYVMPSANHIWKNRKYSLHY